MRLVPRSRVGRLIALVAMSPLLLGGFLGVQLLAGNYHEVIPNVLYRSAQPTAAMIKRAVKEDGIKTIINLRGSNPARDWYREEVRAAEEAGIQHINFRMSAKRQLTQQQVTELVNIMRDAPKPILIHCQAGSDRSGLAASLYLALIAKTPTDEAERALSIRYGHFSIPYLSAAYPMDETWDKVEDWYELSDDRLYSERPAMLAR